MIYLDTIRNKKVKTAHKLYLDTVFIDLVLEILFFQQFPVIQLRLMRYLPTCWERSFNMGHPKSLTIF